MKKILPYFKGKVSTNVGDMRLKALNLKPGDQVYGHLDWDNHNENKELRAWINGIEVDVQTIEWSTGQKDKNGKDVFGGDILFLDDGEYGLIKWNSRTSAFCITTQSRCIHNPSLCYLYEVIGNKYDNRDIFKDILKERIKEIQERR